MPSTTKPVLVLASASPRRAALLAQAGIKPAAIVSPEIDESVQKGEQPRPHAQRLAAEKARAARARWTGGAAYIVAADTVVACGRRILPKAESDDQVRACLELLSGRRHQVMTAVSLSAPNGKLTTKLALTRVSFRRLSAAEIAAYVDSREGQGKAGGYAIQGRAECFVKEIAGAYSNVVGLPLAMTLGMLEGAGWRNG
jgi:septum formation protein